MKNNLRRSLWASVLSLVLCLAMAVGTTFAWFTDSVTSGVNRIVAGNLDIEVQYKNDNTSGWKDLEGSDSVFSKGLWEPGHTEFVTLKIENKGTLALNYKALVTPVSEIGGINVYGDMFKLSDYLVFGTTVPATTEPSAYTRESAREAVGETKGLNVSSLTQTSSLLPGKTEYITLVVYMPETVENEANYKTGTAAPAIELGVKVMATQKVSETDSFDDKYDENAVIAPEYLLGSAYRFFKQISASKKAITDKETVVEFKVENETKAKATVPANGAENGTEVTLDINKTEAPNNFTIDDGQSADHYEVEMTGIEDGTLVRVEWFVGKALTGVEVKHNNVAMTEAGETPADQTYKYDSETGFVTVWTTTFSPFSIIYDSAEAALNGKLYGTLEAAYTAAKANDTVFMLKDVELKYALNAKSNVTLDMNGYKITASTDTGDEAYIYENGVTKNVSTGAPITGNLPNASYYVNYSSMTTSNGSAVALFNVPNGVTGVVVKNGTFETKAFTRCNIGTGSGSSLTLDNITLIHKEYSSRGNDAIQLNGALIVKNSLKLEMGSCIRYFDSGRSSTSATYKVYQPDGFTQRAWGGISFNSAGCSVDFTDCTSFVVTDGGTAKDGEEAYGLTQAVIHIYPVSEEARNCVVGWENIEGLVKTNSTSHESFGFDFEDSRYVNSEFSAKLSGVSDTQYFMSFADAFAASVAGDTITLLKDLELKNVVNAKSGVTLDGNGHSIVASTAEDSYYMGDSSKTNAASAAVALINVGTGVNTVIKNITLETKAYARCNIGTSAGSTLTLDNVVLKHIEYSARGNDGLQLNGALIVKNSLRIEMGSNIRYFKDKNGGEVEGGFTNRAWGGISFNSADCSIDFTECTSFVMTDGGTAIEGDEAYGITQAPIHLYPYSEDQWSKVVGWENIEGLVKCDGGNNNSFGFAFEGSDYLTRNGFTKGEDGVYRIEKAK